MDRMHLLRDVLRWLRAGYPDGVPTADYSPVLALLRREQLTDAEVELVAEQLAAGGVVEPDGTRHPISAAQVTESIAGLTHVRPEDADVARVADRLRAHGWPFLPALPDHRVPDHRVPDHQSPDHHAPAAPA